MCSLRPFSVFQSSFFLISIKFIELCLQIGIDWFHQQHLKSDVWQIDRPLEDFIYTIHLQVTIYFSKSSLFFVPHGERIFYVKFLLFMPFSFVIQIFLS